MLTSMLLFSTLSVTDGFVKEFRLHLLLSGEVKHIKNSEESMNNSKANERMEHKATFIHD